jgi:hypothetical protein
MHRVEVFLETLITAQLVEKFYPSNEDRMFITLFTNINMPYPGRKIFAHPHSLFQ